MQCKEVYRHSGDERAISCLVKGIKFYDGIGIFSSFDNVILVREPNNPFDTNSVLVILAFNNREVLARGTSGTFSALCKHALENSAKDHSNIKYKTG